MQAEPPPADTTVVAVVNTNPDIVRLLRIEIERAGFIVIVVHIEEIKRGEANVESFLRQHDPRVIVYDVAPPYDLNWRFLDHLRTSTLFRGRQFVLTSVNVQRVRKIVGTDETVFEVAGEPRDLGEILRAVREAARARPVR